MANTTGDIKDDFLVQMQANSTIAFYTDAILDEWLDNAHRWAAGYKKWPYTEGRISTTYVSGTEEWTFENIKSDSIRLLQLEGKRLQKLNFEDYQRYKEEQENGTDRVFSDFGNVVFINPNVDVGGTLTIWAQYNPSAFDRTDPSLKTVFSDRADEANEAITEEMMSYAKKREKKMNEAVAHHKSAMAILDNIWEQVTAEQFGYHSKDRGMFERFNVEAGAVDDELLKRNQWF